jgi:hypothetical protein
VVLIATCNPASISTLHCKKTVYFGVKTEKIITRKWKAVLGEVAPHKSDWKHAKNQSNCGDIVKKERERGCAVRGGGRVGDIPLV